MKGEKRNYKGERMELKYKRGMELYREGCHVTVVN